MLIWQTVLNLLTLKTYVVCIVFKPKIYALKITIFKCSQVWPKARF